MRNRARYTLNRINQRFVVVDSMSSEFRVMNSEAKMADNRKSSETKYFGMSGADARKLADDLNERFHFKR
jgi:hypothetical protein